MASSAALAVGAVGVAAGLVPSPDGSGGFAFRDAGSTSTVQAGAAAPAPQGGDTSSDSGRAGTTPSRDTARPSAPVTVTMTATTTTTATPTQSPSPGAVSSSPAATASPSSGGLIDDLTGELNAKNQEAQVVNLVNEQRAEAGCAPVVQDTKLTKLAEDFSKDMAKRDFFSHTDPDGNDPWDRAEALGIDNLGGENIARGQADADAVMDAWMNSEGHRANILNCDFKTLGVGFDPANGGPWWTQDFGY